MRVLLFGRDPGAVDQLMTFVRLCRRGSSGGSSDVMAPILEALGVGDDAAAIEPVIFGKDTAFARWDGLARAVHPLPGDLTPAWFEGLGVVAVLTGVEDLDEMAHKRLWELGRNDGVPSVALFDSTSETELRCRDGAGGYVFPQTAFVLSEACRETLLGQGAPAAFVHPGLYRGWQQAEFASYRGQRDAVRAEWGATPEERVVLFVSECFQEMRERGHHDLKIDEKRHLRTLLGMLDAESRQRGTADVRLVVRMHPRDEPTKYEAVLAEASIAVTVSTGGEGLSAACAADLVVGMDSELLRVANAAGCSVRTLEPDCQFAKDWPNAVINSGDLADLFSLGSASGQPFTS